MTDLSTPRKPAVTVGESFGTTVRYTAAEISAFAKVCHDLNPLHHDAEVAARSPFGELIASAPHTPSIMMGVAASHFSRCDDGVRRQMLGLNFNFAFKAPVRANEDVRIEWCVSAIKAHARLGGSIVHIDGTATTARGGAALIGRGTVLVKIL